jgi:hypothetical protein
MSAAIAGKASRPHAHVVRRNLFIELLKKYARQFYRIGLLEAVSPG